MAQATLIGIDVGTTAIKAILIDDDGNAPRDIRPALPDRRGRAGATPSRTRETGWTGVLAALDAFAAAHDLGGAARHRHLLAGQHACLRRRRRSAAAARHRLAGYALGAGCGGARRASDARSRSSTWFGGPMPIDASHALARMAHVAADASRTSTHATRHVLAAQGLLRDAADRRRRQRPDLGRRPRRPRRLCRRHCSTWSPARPKSSPPLLRLHPSSPAACAPGCPAPARRSSSARWMPGAACSASASRASGDAMYQSGTSEIPGIVSSTVTQRRA